MTSLSTQGFGEKCSALIIRPTDGGKKAEWATYKSWEVRFYTSGKDPGVLFTI